MAVLAGACWAVAIFVFAGGVFAEDVTARILFGLIWIFTGIWWLLQYNRSRRGTTGTTASDPAGSAREKP
jgi:hypothetical protein